MCPVVNNAGEIVTYEIPWLQECKDRERGLIKAKREAKPKFRAPRYELIHRLPKPEKFPDEWRWSIKITKHNGSVEWIDDFYEKERAEAEIIRLRDKFDAHHYKQAGRGDQYYRGVGHGYSDGTWAAERGGFIDSPWE